MPDTRPAGRSMEDAVSRRLRIADLVVDLGQASVSRDGEPLPLPGLSFDLLVVLARSAPDLVSHDQLMERVWRGVVVSPETISQRIKLLRDALGDDPREPRYVAGVRGRGYRLVAAVEPLADPEPRLPQAPIEPPLQREPAPEPEPALSSGPSSSDVESGSPPTPVAVAASPARPARARAVALVAASLVLAAGLVFWLRGGWHTTPVDAPAIAAAGSGTTSVDVVGLPPRTVAVLPFQTLSADPADRFIGLGVAEMVLNRLAGSEALFVLARSSSFAFEERNVDAREIGRQLGARYLVQGSVQRAGDALRVTAQLVDAQSGRQLQALSFDRRVAGLFAVQDEIATQVAAALDVAIGAPQRATTRVEAQLEYLQGLAVAGRWRIAEFETAIGHFRRAREIDPGFAAAYVAEAQIHLRRAGLQVVPQSSELPLVRPLVERALQLDPQLGAAWVVRSQLPERAGQAEADLRRGIALAPNDALGYFELAERVSREPGRLEEANELFERAIRLDPLQPRYRYVRALVMYLVRNQPESFEAAMLDVLKVDPNYTQALTRLAILQAYFRGRFAASIELIERSLATDPDSAFARERAADLYLNIGDPGAAADVLADTAPGSAERVALALRRGDRLAAGRLAVETREDGSLVALRQPTLNNPSTFAALVALRDEVTRRGDPARGLRLLRRYYCQPLAGGPDCLERDALPGAVMLAQLEKAAGNAARGRDIATRVLAAAQARAGRPAFDTAVRAMALVTLGRDDEAVRALVALPPAPGLWNAWIILEHDAAFDPLRTDPRFQAVATAHRVHLAREREALEVLRRDGRVPRRKAD